MDTIEFLVNLIDTTADGAIVVGVFFFYKLDKRVAALESMLKNGLRERIKRLEGRLDSHIDSESR